MISIIKLERCIVGAGIFGIIVSEVCYRKKPCPIILLKVDKGLKIGFYHTILSFNLAVCLQVEDGRVSPFDAKEIA